MHRSAGRKYSRRLAFAGALAACLGLATAIPAEAVLPGSKIARPANSVVTGQCSFSVKSIDTLASTARVSVTGQARGVGFNNFKIVYTSIACTVFTADHQMVVLFIPSANSYYVNKTQTTTIPLSTSYTVCGQAFAKLRNGDQSVTGNVCV